MTDEELAHYGVLGMKWGRRRNADPAQIRSARVKVARQAEQIHSQRRKVNVQTRGTKQYNVEKSKLDSMNMSYLKNPDRAVAARMTRGEKIATLLITGVGGPTGLIGLGAIGASSARSRLIEQKQETGAYDKKK